MKQAFNLNRAIPILERTPSVLSNMLKGLPDAWVFANEGPDTWSPYDIVGHLIHGEKTDWIPRIRHILSQEPSPFEPFDRFAQFTNSKGKSLDQLLTTFTELRSNNIEILKGLSLTEADLLLEGIHPALGTVKLAQLLSTWTVHDLNHIAQVARVMANVYGEETGPWSAYLSILKSG